MSFLSGLIGGGGSGGGGGGGSSGIGGFVDGAIDKGAELAKTKVKDMLGGSDSKTEGGGDSGGLMSFVSGAKKEAGGGSAIDELSFGDQSEKGGAKGGGDFLDLFSGKGDSSGGGSGGGSGGEGGGGGGDQSLLDNLQDLAEGTS